MKRYFTMFALSIALLTVTACEWTIGDSKFETDPVTVSASMLTGKTFAQQPYAGTEWGDTTYEIIKFEEGRVIMALGTLEDPNVRSTGSWGVARDGKTIGIDGLQIFDHLSGNRYRIVKGQVGSMKSGRLALYLAFDNGEEIIYDPMFVYTEIN